MWSAVEFSHLVLASHIKAGMTAVDATMGNGHDTMFLLELVGAGGRVFSFDVQQRALDATSDLLHLHPYRQQCHLLLRSHVEIAATLAAASVASIDALTFNLGYLPGSDKQITTTAQSTITALTNGLTLLGQGGIATLVCYTGHEGAREERDAVLEVLLNLHKSEYRTGRYTAPGRADAPECLIIERVMLDH